MTEFELRYRRVTCQSCQGTGRVRWQYPALHAITCPWCHGTGAQ